jgi:membrane-bound lytic murein transglycosylase D
MATDYWSLNLHKETMAYVPRLLAVAKIFANAEEYNLPLRPIANKPVFTMIDIGSQLDLTKAAELAEISLTELKVLNPAFNRQGSTPKSGPHRLLIPVEKADIFEQQLAALPNSKRVKYRPKPKRVKRRTRTTRHKVKRGENIGLLAKKYHTSVSAIRRANNMTGSKIYPGKRLKIPSASQARKYKKSPKRITYRVRKGETLSSIGRKYSVSISNLRRWNKLRRKSILKAGQRLVMYNAKTRKSTKRVKYTVRKGDSLALISRKFNVSINSLRKWNKLGKYIKPGQKLAVLRPTT